MQPTQGSIYGGQIVSLLTSYTYNNEIDNNVYIFDGYNFYPTKITFSNST